MNNGTLEAARQGAGLAGPPGGWRDSALCAQTDPEIFFPDKGESVTAAKRVCRSCEVRAECLQEALDRGERFGVWGGLSERERRALAARLAGQPARVWSYPVHGEELSGGPVLCHCPADRLGHGVTADLAGAAGARKDAA